MKSLEEPSNESPKIVSQLSKSQLSRSQLDKFDGENVECNYLHGRALIKCALDGVEFNYKDDIDSLKIFFIYSNNHFKLLNNCAVILLHLIAIWEDINLNNITNGEYSKSFKTVAINLIEVFCFSIMFTRLLYLNRCSQFKLFWADYKNITQLALIFITMVDIIFHFSNSRSILSARWSRCLRPLFILLLPENRQLRRIVNCVYKTLPAQVNVLTLYFLSLGFYSLMAFKLFSQRKLFDQKFFGTYTDSVYHLYVLVTTTNNPSIMLPAFNQNHIFALFFVIFLIINWLLFMNITLAVIYNSYRAHLKAEISDIHAIRLANLNKAFEVITGSTVKNDPRAGLTREQFNHIAMDVPKYNPTFGSVCSRHYLYTVWYLLETQGLIKRREFLKILELPIIQIYMVYPVGSDELSTPISRFFSQIYDSSASMMFRIMVQSVYYQYTFELILIINLILLAIDTSPDCVDVEYYILSLSIFDNLAKLYAQGIIIFTKQFWNLYSAITTLLGLIILFLIVTDWVDESRLTPHLDVTLVLLALPLIRLFRRIGRFHTIMNTSRWLIPFVINFAIIMISLFYFFAIIGIILFAGLIKPDPEGCSVGTIDCCPANLTAKGITYCTINFNSITTAYLLLFDLLAVNDWHQFVKNYEIVTDNQYFRLYFLAFHLICVIVFLNCFTAFIIESFILKYTKEDESLQIIPSSPPYSEPTLGNGHLINRIRRLTRNNHPKVRLACNPIVRLFGRHSGQEMIAFNIPENNRFHVEITEANTVESTLIRLFQKELLEEEEERKKIDEVSVRLEKQNSNGSDKSKSDETDEMTESRTDNKFSNLN